MEEIIIKTITQQSQPDYTREYQLNVVLKEEKHVLHKVALGASALFDV